VKQMSPCIPVLNIVTESGRMKRVGFLDDKVLKGAIFTDCIWVYREMPDAEVQAHIHDFDEVIGFFGTDKEDSSDLCGEIEFWLDNEKYTITKSCLIFIPRGLKHCPLFIKKVDKPIFWLTAGNTSEYSGSKN
jgi:hypothetical protein